MPENSHLYIFKTARDIKFQHDKLHEILYDKFFQPTARHILVNWIDNFQNCFYYDKDHFDELCNQLNYNDLVLEDVITSLCLHIMQQVKYDSNDKYAYISFIQKPTLLFEIKELIEETINDHNS